MTNAEETELADILVDVAKAEYGKSRGEKPTPLAILDLPDWPTPLALTPFLALLDWPAPMALLVLLDSPTLPDNPIPLALSCFLTLLDRLLIKSTTGYR